MFERFLNLVGQAEVKPPTFQMPRQASTFAAEVDWMYYLIYWICVVFFVLIVGVMFYFMWKYRRKSHTAADASGPTHNTPLEVTWTVIPLILVIMIFYLGASSFMRMVAAPQDSYEIQVTAQKWSWTFKYPNGATYDDLVIPAGRPVRLRMRSEDVLHSLFVPDFRAKQDVVPGRYTYLWFQADNPTGAFPFNDEDDFHWLFCTEYCGTGHSNMNRKVRVLAEGDFLAFLDERERWLEDIPEEERYYKAGPILFKRCAQCHAIQGTNPIGPTWEGLWERTANGTTEFADGSRLADKTGPGKEYAGPDDYIRNSILNPQSELVKGYGPAMPTFKGQLRDMEIDVLIEFIKRLDEFNADGTWKNAAGE